MVNESYYIKDLNDEYETNKELKMKELKGTVALIPTPLTDDGKIDEKGLRNLIDYEV
jgi:hypothetical protein